MMISLDCYELCIHVRDNNIADTNYNYMYTLKYPEKEVPEFKRLLVAFYEDRSNDIFLFMKEKCVKTVSA